MSDTFPQAVNEIDNLARDNARLERELQRAERDREMLRDQARELLIRVDELKGEVNDMTDQLAALREDNIRLLSENAALRRTSRVEE